MLTTRQFQTLDDLYAFYNVQLFGASLPECIINLSRRPHSKGFFVPRLWVAIYENNTNDFSHEISLNPDYLLRPSIEWHATFVHEMVHLWQHEFGNPARAYFHNREWVDKMETIGLIPSHTGEPGGKKIGQSISHYIDPNGLFHKVFYSLDDTDLEALRLRYLPVVSLEFHNKRNADLTTSDNDEADEGTEATSEDKTETSGSVQNKTPKSKSGVRIKYSCSCGNNIWGRSGLLIHCLECDDNYTVFE